MKRLFMFFLIPCLLVLLGGSITEAAPTAQSGDDWSIPSGHFYTQTAPLGFGFSVLDDGQAKFWTEFNRLGGLQNVGYPISRRFEYHGFTVQAFQKLVLQWRPEVNQAWPMNVFDQLSRKGFDDVLFVARQTPYPLQNFDPPGATWAQIVANRQALLSANPSIRARYFSLPDPLTVFGLPVSRVEDMGNHYAIRTQRAVFQQWKEAVPWAAAGQVTIANGGDIAKELGWLPAAAIQPEPVGTPNTATWQTVDLLVAANQAQTIIAVQNSLLQSSEWRLIVSGNGGQTWAPGLSLPDCVSSVTLDYSTVNRYYAATCEGIYRWNGASWDLVSAGYYRAVSVRYNNPNELWATVFQAGVPVPVRSTDNGTTWNPVGLERALGVAELMLDPTSPLAYLSGNARLNAALYRSTGGDWEALPMPYAGQGPIYGSTLDGQTGDLYFAMRDRATAASAPVVLWKSSNSDAVNPTDVT